VKTGGEKLWSDVGRTIFPEPGESGGISFG
jgi:hypothetical protein